MSFIRPWTGDGQQCAASTPSSVRNVVSHSSHLDRSTGGRNGLSVINVNIGVHHGRAVCASLLNTLTTPGPGPPGTAFLTLMLLICHTWKRSSLRRVVNTLLTTLGSWPPEGHLSEHLSTLWSMRGDLQLATRRRPEAPTYGPGSIVRAS